MTKGGQKTAPTNSQVQKAQKLYDSGDVRSARRLALQVLQDQASEPDHEQARVLLDRAHVPAIAWGLGAIAAVFLLGLITLAMLRS